VSPSASGSSCQATVGVRAARPTRFGHIDASVLKLLDGTKAYIHAVIDNFSRKILAWTIGARLDPIATCRVLVEAGQHLARADPRPAITVMADSGVENVNAAVDSTLLAEGLHRVLAQVEVTESNSMIEAWWRSLKHHWLFLNSLDILERVRTLVAFFVVEHNTKMPHTAFRGLTPDEAFFGTAPNLSAELDAARAKASELRVAANRSVSCNRCAPTAETEIPP